MVCEGGKGRFSMYQTHEMESFPRDICNVSESLPLHIVTLYPLFGVGIVVTVM